jgi:hypothetical protein
MEVISLVHVRDQLPFLKRLGCLDPSVCQGSDIPCACDGPTPMPGTTAFPGMPGGNETTTTPSTTEDPMPGDPATTRMPGTDTPYDCRAADMTCVDETSDVSCEWPGPGSETTMMPGTNTSVDCRTADLTCVDETSDVYSYCKYWQDPPVCHGSDIPCSCEWPGPGSETTMMPGTNTVDCRNQWIVVRRT